MRDCQEEDEPYYCHAKRDYHERPALLPFISDAGKCNRGDSSHEVNRDR